MKFRKGDIIVGNDMASDYYCITKKGWTGEVIYIRDERYFSAKSTDGISRFDGLDENCFDLFTPAVDRDQMIALLS